ncbi:MAG: hypothetical protein M1608_16475 [Candidatus Omnitrophica bacterium]|nr:hypothetical protein [Candidatus Omnitrophota bacterium]
MTKSITPRLVNSKASRAFAVAIVWTLFFLPSILVAAERTATSGDAYIRFEGNRWVLGTASVEKTVALEGGKLFLQSFKSKATGLEMTPDNGLSDEFFILLGDKCERVSGAAGNWRLAGDRVQKLNLQATGSKSSNKESCNWT